MDRRIWDSLAIIEYLHEPRKAGHGRQMRHERAHARSVSAEMHSGFAALRGSWPMQAASKDLRVPLSACTVSPMSRASMRSGRTAALCTRPQVPGCSARTARRTRCTPRWCCALTLMEPRFRSVRDLRPPCIEDPHLQSWIAAAAAEIGTRTSSVTDRQPTADVASRTTRKGQAAR